MKPSLILILAGVLMLMGGLFFMFIPRELIWTIGLMGAIFGILMVVLGFVITVKRGSG